MTIPYATNPYPHKAPAELRGPKTPKIEKLQDLEIFKWGILSPKNLSRLVLGNNLQRLK